MLRWCASPVASLANVCPALVARRRQNAVATVNSAMLVPCELAAGRSQELFWETLFFGWKGPGSAHCVRNLIQRTAMTAVEHKSALSIKYEIDVCIIYPQLQVVGLCAVGYDWFCLVLFADFALHNMPGALRTSASVLRASKLMHSSFSRTFFGAPAAQTHQERRLLQYVQQLSQRRHSSLTLLAAQVPTRGDVQRCVKCR